MERADETFDSMYNKYGDEALLEAHQVGPEGYVPAAWLAISREFERRGLIPAPTHITAPCAPSSEPEPELPEVLAPLESENEARAFVISELSMGKSCKDILSGLQTRGMSSDIARKLLERVGQEWLGSLERVFNAQWNRGALWAIGGVLVTAVTYFAAQPEGTYVVAWGAIVYGIVTISRASSRLDKLRAQVLLD